MKHYWTGITATPWHVTYCKRYTDKISQLTENIDEVTCKDCLRRLKSLKGEKK